ncbi:MAG: hypothetical protein CMQ46_06845 [Gammaproteobacteria bacterium]|nr:hypothetical protein [Gammaproteobacteria bacterium]MBJ54959.1 hypothetical protein [Gammaproteobacteria bacterium]HBN16196.1 hypothetical protein [Pseudohongiella sp.]|tara:strand:- start:216 stop:1070 length:855 start_codon:yes stop_codon:yes gene_type:complete
MRALAAFAMAGRRQAIIAAVLCGIIPLINMISPALVALVLLRHGPREALMVAAFAVLPLIGWASVGDMTPLILLVGVGVMAAVLRRTASWQYALLAAILVAVGSEAALMVRPAVMDLLLQQVEAFMAAGGESAELPEVTPETLREGVLTLFGLMHMLMAVFLLILARWWQALMYNPGGFQKEFHEFRLQPSVAMLLVGLFLLASLGGTVLTGWILYFVIPLAIAGVALVHGLVGIKRLSRLFLVAFYLLLLSPLAVQLLSVAALLDSFYDFRRRIQPPADDGSI